MSGRGRNATVGLWLDLFDEHATRSVPQVGLAHALHQLASGDAGIVSGWTDLAEQALRNGAHQDTDRARLELAVAAIRSLVGEPSLTDIPGYTGVVIAAGPDGNPWWGLAHLLQGVALLLMGDPEAAVAPLREAERSSADQPHVQAVAIAQQAHVDLHLGRWDGAARRVARAKQIATENALDDYLPIIAVVAVAALVEAHSGDTAKARHDAQRARRLLTAAGEGAIVRTGMQVCALLACTEMLLGDHVAARTLVDEGRAFTARDPAARLPIEGLDAVDEELRQLEATAPVAHTPAALGPSSLTTAELRVLEYLPTHLSLKEIAEKIYVSRNTVKSQAIATYRKLGVSSRGEAVATARALGLIDS